ncbi:MAG: minor capsid protein [Magnetococcales bacterium]|nr:minor capsid protein [Magnetococcales bacterium]
MADKEAFLDPLPMKEAVEFWKSKTTLTPGEYAKLTDEMKVKAFAVGGVAKKEQLTTIFNSMQLAVDDGISFGDFKKDIRDIADKRGWSRWRMETIFRTNIQTAYHVGRYKQMKQVAERRPYWQYDAVGDKRTRPTHNALDGTVHRHDSSFWSTWYPPNGFRCRCGVISLSARQVKRLGLTVTDKDPTGGLIEPKLADGSQQPARPLIPDPGFAHNPGQTQWGYDGPGEKSARWKDFENLPGPANNRRPKLANLKPADIPDLTTKKLPKGQTNTFYKDKFLDLYGEETVLTDPAGEAVVLTLRSFLATKNPKLKKRWKFKKEGHGEMIPLLKEAVEKPLEIWVTPQRDPDSGRIRLVKRYVSLWKTPNKERIGGLAVFEVVDGKFQGVTAFMPFQRGTDLPDLEYLELIRKGLLLHPGKNADKKKAGQ